MVVRSRAGRIIDRSIDGTDSYPAGNNYRYDTVGRLISAHVGGDVYDYTFAATGGCGASAQAGKNANRTSVSINAATAATFCYDTADRLTQVISTTAPFDDYTGAIGYDSHGNTTTLAGQELVYDAANRHLATYTPSMANPSSSVVYERDVSNRVVSRTETVAGVASVTRYGYSTTSDSPNVVMDAAGNVIETIQRLPGGVTVTRDTTSEVWSYPDLEGSVTATTDGSGVKQGATYIYDPDGNPLAGVPDNVAGNFDYGWLGQHQRGVDHTPGLRPVMQMGARPYDPALGRFLSVDPLVGKTMQPYVYGAANPIMLADLTGLEPCPKEGCSAADGGGRYPCRSDRAITGNDCPHADQDVKVRQHAQDRVGSGKAGPSLPSAATVGGFLGKVSDGAGVVSIGCLLAALPTKGLSLPCAGFAAGVSTAAAAAELAILIATGGESTACKAGVFAVGALIPGHVDDFAPLEQVYTRLVKETGILGGGLSC